MGLVSKLVLSLVRIASLFFDLFTLPLYLVLQKPWILWAQQKRPQSRHLRPGDPSSPLVRVSDGLQTADLGNVRTLASMWTQAVATFGNRPLLGTREVLREIVGHNSMKKFQVGNYWWLSYRQAGQRVEQVARGLGALGVRAGDRVVILSETRAEWLMSSLACHTIGAVVATLYANLGTQAILYGLEETEAEVLIVSSELLPKFKNAALPSTKYIIYYEGRKATDISQLPSTVRLLSFKELETLGRKTKEVPEQFISNEDDLAIIMYTSGSTGVPKGVELTHKNIFSAIKELISQMPPVTPSSRHSAYLPLAHIFELMTEYSCIWAGVAIGYSSPLTLLRNGTGLMSGCKSDVEELRPFFFNAVPLMLDRISKGVSAMAAAKGSLVKGLFDYATEYKRRWWSRGMDTPLLDWFVFRQGRAILGGQVQTVICAGAPLSPLTEDFVRTVLCVELIPAYGMTETCCVGTCSRRDYRIIGEVGCPLRTNYIRLVDWKEGGYEVTDRPRPRGEVLIGGDSVARGYFKQDQLTAETFVTLEGVRYCRSGDIGELTPHGTLIIIDRMKDLVKLNTGEYVSLGRVEAELKTSPLVDNLCVLGSGCCPFLAAVVCPNVFQLSLLARQVGRDGLDVEEQCKDRLVLDAYATRLRSHGTKCGLKKLEIPARYKLTTDSWTPANGLVTAAFKIRRKAIQDRYRADIEQLFHT